MYGLLKWIGPTCMLLCVVEKLFNLRHVSPLEVEESPLESYNEEILIDSLLSIEEHGGPESSKAPLTDGQKPRKDIAEVAAAAELLLPKGSARATAVVCFVFYCVRKT